MKKIFVPLFLILIIATASAATTVKTPTTKNYLSVTESPNLIIKSTNYDPSPAEPGKYVDVWIVVQNLGNKKIQRSWLKIKPEYPFSLNPGETGIEEVALIPAGREELMEYRLRVDDQAIEGTYDFDVVLCETPTCEIELRKTSIDIAVRTGGKPKLEIGLESSTVFLPETLGEITISAVNKGKLGIKFLTIEVMDSEEYELISPARVYLGELDSDDFETEDFRVYTHSSTGIINVPVKVEYSDENFKEYTSIENIEFKVFSEKDAKNIGLVSTKKTGKYFALAAIILLAFLYRRRKKKHES